MKSLLTEAPILAYPNPTDPFILDTDASDQAVGGVLSQIQDGKERVIAYASHSLQKPERRYCATRKELLAIVVYLKYFRHYFYGQEFLVRTDREALRWLFNFKHPEEQIARWLEVLGTYNFTIEHRPGRQHGNADGMSRITCKQCGMEVQAAAAEARHLCGMTTCQAGNWVEGLTPADIKEKQLEDPPISRMIHWKEEEVSLCHPWTEILRLSGGNGSC